MNLQQLIQSLDYLYCCEQGHKEELSLICLQSRCDRQALICAICQEKRHNGHKTISLKDYLQSLKLGKQQQNVSEAFKQQKRLNQLHLEAKQGISNLKSSFLEQIYQLQCKIDSYFNNLYNVQTEIYEMKCQNYVSKALSHYSKEGLTDSLKDLILRIKTRNQFQISQIFQLYYGETRKKIARFTEYITNMNYKEKFNKAKQGLSTINHPFGRVQYVWSQLKAQSIVINGSIAQQTQSNSNGERFALAEANLVYQNSKTTDSSNKDIKIAFRINKLKGWIGIGICLKQAILKCNYKFNYTQTYHGSYLISANGYSWSHSQPEFNSAFKSFIFSQGDIVFIQYSVSENSICFRSKNTLKQFNLTTLPCPNDDCYVPCINICNPGDEVEIVSEID